MKLSNYAVDQVYKLLSPLNKKKYLHGKPDADNEAEYIVINSLPVGSGSLQRTYVNVNCYVKDVTPGWVNRPKLDALAQSALNILEKVTTPEILIDYEGSELIREQKRDEHYYNLRFKVTIVN